MERFIERLIYACRWLLAPVYLGIGVALIALAIKFFQELGHLLFHILEIAKSDLVLTLLSLVDLVLVGSLLCMVMISGYENFVSRLELHEETEKLSWLGKLDSGFLKAKVSASIVAISSIHLLEIFINVERVSNEKLLWYLLLQLTFVVSALIMVLIDRMAKHEPPEESNGGQRD